MNYTISDGVIAVSVSDRGAELQSIRRLDDGTEYLWQGDPTYWTGRAYNLFPVCGRVFGDHYTYDGKTYAMNRHGFARNMTWSVETQTDTSVTFVLTESDESMAVYPFAFRLAMTFTVSGGELTVTTDVTDTDEKPLIFSFGGHPGFNVPLGGEGSFEDYEVVFDAPCEPQRICTSETVYYLGCSKPFPLENGQILHLSHDMFNDDAIFLHETARGLTLRSAKARHSLHVSFPDAPYIGFWHKPFSDAPYLCIEPWQGIPSSEGKMDELTAKLATVTVQPGDVYTHTWVFTAR